MVLNIQLEKELLELTSLDNMYKAIEIIFIINDDITSKYHITITTNNINITISYYILDQYLFKDNKVLNINNNDYNNILKELLDINDNKILGCTSYNATINYIGDNKIVKKDVYLNDIKDILIKYIH